MYDYQLFAVARRNGRWNIQREDDPVIERHFWRDRNDAKGPLVVEDWKQSDILKYREGGEQREKPKDLGTIRIEGKESQFIAAFCELNLYCKPLGGSMEIRAKFEEDREDDGSFQVVYSVYDPYCIQKEKEEMYK